MNPLRYLFFGTSEFSVCVLSQMEKLGRTPTAIISQPDKPKGRGRTISPTETKRWANQRSILVIQFENQSDKEYLNKIQQLEPDVCLVAAFGQLLPKTLLAIPNHGFINVHPSLIPRYRGAAPIQWTLINGDQVTGTTILTVTPKFDAGDILAQATLAIEADEQIDSLTCKLGILGGKLACQVFNQLEQGSLQRTKQDESGIVWANALRKEDGLIDWNQPSRTIHNRIRGVQKWPGAKTSLNGKMLKLFVTSVVPNDQAEEAPAGTVIKADTKGLWVRTQDGALSLEEVQLQHKRRMSARDLVNGRQIARGNKLGSCSG